MLKLMIRTGCAICVLLWASQNAYASNYVMKDLGLFAGYSNTRAIAINDSSQVAILEIDNYNMSVCLFDYNNGRVVTRSSIMHSVTDVNNRGQMTGNRFDSVSEPAVMNADGTIIDLAPVIHSNSSSAFAINDDGQVIGYSDNHIILWQVGSNAVIDLTADIADIPYDADISNTGIAVYSFSHLTSSTELVTMSLKRDSNGVVHNLSFLDPTVAAIVHSVSDSGAAVGSAGNHAVLWTIDGTPIDLGGSTGEYTGGAFDINDAGQIVGELNRRAVLWNPDLSSTVLDSLPGGSYSFASGINNLGQIVGCCTGADGYDHAVLWQPVPEPSSLATLLCGLAGVGTIVRRRKG